MQNSTKRFQKSILDVYQDIKNMPYRHRKSIYHDNEDIRDIIIKGYTIVYLIGEDETITVLALINQERYNQG